MSKPETQALPPRVTIDLTALHRTVLQLQDQHHNAATLEAHQDVIDAAIHELRTLAYYTDAIQVLHFLVERSQQHINRLANPWLDREL